MKSKTLIFFGNERLATGVTTQTPVLRSLIDSGYKIDLLVANQSGQSGRKRRTFEVEEIARTHGIELYVPPDNNALVEKIRSSDANFAVLAAYGKLVPKKVIDCFEHGIINIHPSLLPKLRGTTPIETALLAGMDQTGVSIMRLVEAMDAGPIYKQQRVDIEDGMSKQVLSDKLSGLGAELLLNSLPSILSGNMEPEPQEEADATFTKMISKKDSHIDWSKPAMQIEREVRAHLGWPGSKTELSGKELTVTEAEVLDYEGKAGQHRVEGKRIIVHCSEKSIAINKLKPAGKPEMTAEAFLAGNRI